MGSSTVFDAVPDTPDQRDWIYRPNLASLPAKIKPSELSWLDLSRVRDQKQQPSCTGHALAALIDLLLDKQLYEDNDYALPDSAAIPAPWASAYMLYKNAQFHDEWEGEAYSGSSLRGVIKGFFHNGVCSLDTEKKLRREFDRHGIQLWHSNHELVSQSRQVRLGAYYRVRSRLTDVHAALNETGILLVSAKVHSGWTSDLLENSEIEFGRAQREESGARRQRRHAFIVLGYDEGAFWIQNSWGRGWGLQGRARWSYADWAANILDTWVLQLAVPVPQAFRLPELSKSVDRASSADERRFAIEDSRRSYSSPTRLDVLGHMITVENGRIKRNGRYHHDLETLKSTFRIVAHRLTTKAAKRLKTPFAPNLQKTQADDLWYRHVHIQILGGSRGEIATALHVHRLQEIYKANRIYPLFLHWEPGAYSEVYQILQNVLEEVSAQTHTDGAERTELRERLIELRLATMGRRLKHKIDQASSRFFFELVKDPREKNIWCPKAGEGIEMLNMLLEQMSWRFRNRSISYHFTAHGFGVWVIAHLLRSHELLDRQTVLSSVNLISPAIDVFEFESEFAPFLTAKTDGPLNRAARLPHLLIERANLWHASAEDARVDTFHESYSHSWPELWSRVIGNIARNEAWEADPTRPGLPHLSRSEKLGPNVFRAKLLSLAEFAEEAATLASSRSWPVEINEMSRANGRPRRSRHFGMDLSPHLVNELIARILGDPASMTVRYSNLD